MDKMKSIGSGFIQVDKEIVFNSGLSLQALGLYNVIKSLSDIPDFKLNKQYIRKITGLGVKPFDKVWSELKEAGILLMEKKRTGSKWNYIFELKKELQRKIKEVRKVVEEVKEKVNKIKEAPADTDATNTNTKNNVYCSKQHYYNKTSYSSQQTTSYNNYNNKKKTLKFMNFDQRTYDYDELEKKLLGWD